jgi:hypothetical protein
VEKKNGQEKLLAEPRLITLEDRPASFANGGPRTIDLGGGKTEEVNIGTSVGCVVRSGEKDKLRFDAQVSFPTRVIIGDAVILEMKTVRFLNDMELGATTESQMTLSEKPPSVLQIAVTILEMESATKEQTIAQAEKVLKTAEAHRRAGRTDSARSYYDLICQRYPDTIYAERARERLAELKKAKEKPPSRIGQIFISGNKKLSEEAVLKKVPLFPGEILNFPDLDIADRNLARLKGVKSAKVSVIDREGEGVYKDIHITVEEK